MEECEGAPAARENGGMPGDERLRAQKLAAPDEADVQRVVDAVTGATWGERNRIMEGLFEERRAADPGAVPAFSPPGTPIEKGREPR
ncbi:hypothetical protein NE582_04190 [Gordonibacter pamelaeae]|uniref:hypothetical protein n=1 Tax=Gordonibacter pamelaeae TaxID=471189 RepID=UPI0012AF66BE|nr:hypothetical protein [Gordonibacter pamelaeae]MCQ4846417.1 hypothetical protein [Gordonibacter pamelaeae]MCQ4849902.1 hypothetical protein [Gordonibacter pamelaeae]MSA62038.1 hypothetical protein [Gordonibacter pamelaeae]